MLYSNSHLFDVPKIRIDVDRALNPTHARNDNDNQETSEGSRIHGC